MGETSDDKSKALGNRLFWFILFWAGGVAAVTLLAYGIRLMIMP